MDEKRGGGRAGAPVRPAAPKLGGGDRLLALLAYIGPLVVIPLLARSKNRFVGYHARQGMYLFGVFIAAFLLTLGLLFVFQRLVPAPPVFLFLSVVMLLEVIAYACITLALAYLATQGKMPMVPVLGDIAGER